MLRSSTQRSLAMLERDMGSFVVNVHVKASDHNAVAKTAERLGAAMGWALAPFNGWVTVLEERASTQDDEWIRQLAGGLASELQAQVIAFMIHDSDVLCYWAFDNDEAIDHYNSCPGYFSDSGEEAGPSGEPAKLLRFCLNGVEAGDLNDALATGSAFAEDALLELSGLLGIDEARVHADFNYLDEMAELLDGAAPIGSATPPDDDDSATVLRFPRGHNEGDELEEEAAPASPTGKRFGKSGMFDAVRRMLGMQEPASAADTPAAKLVQAAAQANIDEIEHWLAAGVNVEVQAALPTPGLTAKLGIGDNLAASAAMLGVPMTPLLAALAHKHKAAARTLLERGADPNAKNPTFGSPLHAAASAGNAELLRLLLEFGGDPKSKDDHGQTPLDALKALRQYANQMAALRDSMPKGTLAQFDAIAPIEGWLECERVLGEWQAKGR